MAASRDYPSALCPISSTWCLLILLMCDKEAIEVQKILGSSVVSVGEIPA